MNKTTKSDSYQSFDCMRVFRDSYEHEPMHPDDYSALCAWVIGKRLYDARAGQQDT